MGFPRASVCAARTRDDLPTLRQNRRLVNPLRASRSGRGQAAIAQPRRSSGAPTRTPRGRRIAPRRFARGERRAARRARIPGDRPPARGAASRWLTADLGCDLRHGDGCVGTPLLPSKKFRYSGRLGGLRSTLARQAGRHRSQGFRVIGDAEGGSSGVAFESHWRERQRTADASSGGALRLARRLLACAAVFSTAAGERRARSSRDGILCSGSTELRFSG